jgi:hypothetical protein
MFAVCEAVKEIFIWPFKADKNVIPPFDVVRFAKIVPFE